MEALQLNAPPLRLVPEDQAFSPLRSARIRYNCWQEHHVLPQPLATIVLVSDLGICKYHEVKAADLY